MGFGTGVREWILSVLGGVGITRRLGDPSTSSGSVFRRVHPSQAEEGYLAGVGIQGGHSAGVAVTPMSALRTSAVVGCYRVITESLSSLPLHLYERLERGKRRAVEHGLYDLLRWEPNPEMTAAQYIETSTGHLLLWGNMYSELEIDGRGRLTGMYPIHPEKVWVQRNRESNELEYKVYGNEGNGVRIVPRWKMFHLPMMSLNGITGISLIGMMRLAVGLSVAAEEYGAAFFENGATPKILLEHPGNLSEEASDRLVKHWEESHQGAGNAHKTVVLEEGMKAHTLTIPPNDAQFLETRKFQVEEIARIYRVPPHMLADLDKATFSNIEHQSLEFVEQVLRPWMVRWEQGIHQQLLLQREKKRYYAEFLVDSLLRGDIQSRYQAYAVGKQWGWLSTNDIREYENMNPVEGGDDTWQPLNMVVVADGQTSGLTNGRIEDPAEQDSPAEQDATNARSKVAGGNDPSHEITPRHFDPAQCKQARGACQEGTALRPGLGTLEEPGKRHDVTMMRRMVEQRAQSASAGRRRATLAWRRVLADASERIVKKEVAELRKLLKASSNDGRSLPAIRNLETFSQQLDGYYDSKFTQFCYSRMYGAMLGYGEEISGLAAEEIGIERDDVMDTTFLENWVSRYANAFISRHIEESRERLAAAMAEADPVGDPSTEIGTTEIENELDAWETSRAAEEGKEESVRMNGALSNKLWALAGVLSMRWKVYGDTCPYCKALDGTVVGIHDNFLQAGIAFTVDDEEVVPLIPRQNKKHPPAHGGCDCGIEAVI